MKLQEKKKKAAIYTLGCKVNQYESDAISGKLKGAGYEMVSFDEIADLYIINTCSVTNMSDRKSRQIIRRAIKQNPEAVVAVAGCYAQMEPEKVASMPGVDIVIGTAGKYTLVEQVEQFQKNGIKNSDEWVVQQNDYEYMDSVISSERTRAFIKIQDGCNQFCSYCIIPYARGRIRSRRLDDIMAEVEKLAKQGYKEIVLTGIHIASYGMEKNASTNAKLIDVIEAVHAVEGIERIRIGSLEPNVVTDDFASRVGKLKKMCPQFHLALQSGCDKTLKRMNRKYTTEDFAVATEKLRKSFDNVVMTTDMIVGFPGETDEDFEESYSFAEKIGFMKIHVFPYSERKGTAAAKFTDQILPEVKAARSERLIALSDRMQKKHMQGLVGSVQEVLIEQEMMIEREKIQANDVHDTHNEMVKFEGHTKLFEKVILEYPKSKVAQISELRGCVVLVNILQANVDSCSGKMLE